MKRTLPLSIAAVSLALTALLFGQQEPSDDQIASATTKSLRLLQNSAATWSRQRQCFSCHHQGLGLMAVSLAGERGFEVDPGRIRAQARFTFQHFLRRKDDVALGAGIVGGPITAAYALAALDAAGFKPNETTDALVQYLLRTQTWDGSWRIGYPHRPPLEDSDFSATALSVRALRAYARNGVREEADLRVHVARSWLTESETEINEDKVYRLLGLRWADAGGRPLGSAMDALIADQREDGGWAQEPGMESDAYATGQALVALRQGGELAVSDEVYRRGVEFLMVTQKGDGSWLVRSRDYPQACQSVLRERFPARRVAVHLRRRDLVGRHGARARQRALAIQPLDFSQEMPP